MIWLRLCSQLVQQTKEGRFAYYTMSHLFEVPVEHISPDLLWSKTAHQVVEVYDLYMDEDRLSQSAPRLHLHHLVCKM